MEKDYFSEFTLPAIFRGARYGALGGVVLGSFCGMVTWNSSVVFPTALFVIVFGALVGLLVGRDRAQFERQRDIANEEERRKKEALKAQAEHLRAQAEEEARKAELQAKVRALLALHSELGNMYDRVVQILRKARTQIDTAEKEYREGAFTPFWDAIDNAVWLMSDFQVATDSLRGQIRKYRVESASVPPPMPAVDEVVKELPDASWFPEKRLKEIVRKAQTNYYFASIYQQRNTNKLLSSGFSSLMEAIDRIGGDIVNSVHLLSDEMGREIRRVSEAHQEQNELLIEIGDVTEKASSDLRTSISEKLDEQTKLLGKIQKGDMR